MREKVFGLLVAVGLIGCAALLPAAGQEEQSASAADSAGAAMAGEIPDLEHGYYNIDEYQRLTGREITGFSESPMLSGRGLPPVAERLPDNPLVMIPLEQVGRYGGTLRAPNFRPNAHVHMHLFNSFRLIHQPPYGAGGIYWFAGPRLWRAQPGVFESWDKSADGRTHTYTIREGLKWSDGVPVTTEDIAYAFNDDFMNSDLRGSPPTWMRWQATAGEATVSLEIVDQYTFRYVFDHPNPSFLAGTGIAPDRWENFIQPAHYMKQFHQDHTSWDELLPVMKEKGFETQEEWPKFYLGMRTRGAHVVTRQMNATEQPTLDPYILTEIGATGDFFWERNPYYAIVDTAGNQLPYIDRVHSVLVADKNVGDLKLIAGELDMDGIFETIADYPLFAENQEAGGYELLLPRHPSNQILLYLVNMGHKDPEIRKILGDLRFRAALSHALDRNQIKETIMRGTGRVAQFATDRGGPYYEEGMEEAYAAYDPDKAKQLLDELGMVDADGDGWRDRLDGEPFLFIFEFPTVQAPLAGADFAKRYWEAIGIRVDVKETSGGAYAKVRNSYENMVTMWHAAGTIAPIDPWFLGGAVANVSWNHWYNTNGEKGIEPPEWYITIRDSQKAYLAAVDEADATEAAKTAWRMQTEYLPVIGTVTGVGHPFVFSRKLGNIARAEELDWDSNGILDYSDQYFFKE